MEVLQKLQIVAIIEHNDIENFKELKNKKISLENHVLNEDLTCSLLEESLVKYTFFEKLIQDYSIIGLKNLRL